MYVLYVYTYTSCRSVEDGPVSLSRCSCCEVRSPSSWTSSSPTPHSRNLCPSSAFSSHIDICLGPLSSDWQEQSGGEASQLEKTEMYASWFNYAQRTQTFDLWVWLICEVNKIENGLIYESKRNWHLLLCLSQTVAVSSRERGSPRWPTTWSRSATVASLPCTSKVRHFLSVWTETWCKTMDESSMSLEKWYMLPKKSVKKKEKITWLFTINTGSSNKYLL